MFYKTQSLDFYYVRTTYSTFLLIEIELKSKTLLRCITLNSKHTLIVIIDESQMSRLSLRKTLGGGGHDRFRMI